VLKAISPGDHVVLCDERGALVTSPQVADLLAGAGEAGTPLVFCIGGPFGHGPAVMARGDTSISFSGCVLNHAVAHVVLVEQLYRGWTILRGEPYHH
jgi:23S rRNA (pseudouridine1915-N3)-methyltransferase